MSSTKVKISWVWKYFQKSDNNEVKCSLCGACLANNNTTSSMAYHLRSKHKKESQQSSEKMLPPSKRLKTEVQPPITSAFQVQPKLSLDYQLAKMACLDGFSFNQIAKSSFIQDNLKKIHNQKVSSHHTVAKYVSNFAQKERDILKSQLRNVKEIGSKFSFTTDEYTAVTG